MNNQAQQQAWFQQYMRTTTLAAFVSSGLFFAAYMLLKTPILLSGTLLFFCSAVSFVCINVLRRTHFTKAVITVCIVALVISVVSTIMFPSFYFIFLTGPLAIAITAIQYFGGKNLRMLLGSCWIALLCMLLLSMYLPADLPIPRTFQIGIMISGLGMGAGLVLLLLGQFSQQQSATVQQLRITNKRLQDVHATLESQVTERTSALQAALDDMHAQAHLQANLLDEIAQQQAVIRDLAMPVIPINRETLVMPLIGVFDSQRLFDVQQQALRALEQTRARIFIIDITGVPIVDTHIAKGILNVVQATRLLGAEAVLVGIRPEVAQTLVGLGLKLPGLRTFSELQAVFDV